MPAILRYTTRMHRLFVALRPPPAVRATLLGIAGGITGIRWQDDDQLHLTLRFIGAVERPVAEDVAAALASIAAPAPAVTLAGVGRFGARAGGDAIWAGIAPRDALTALHAKVDQACIRAGLAPERRAYHPHVTLGRVPRRMAGDPAIDRWLADHAGLGSAPFAPAHLMLYESRLGGEGASYEVVARWPLGTR